MNLLLIKTKNMKTLFAVVGGLMVSVNVLAHGGHTDLSVAGHGAFHGMPIVLGIAVAIAAFVAYKLLHASKK